jgi:hypothetical protein
MVVSVGYEKKEDKTSEDLIKAMDEEWMLSLLSDLQWKQS